MTVKKTYEFDPETDLIGKGGFGRVYKAKDVKIGMEVAIKQYSGNLPAKYSLFEEIKRAIRLNHPNLVRYFDAFELEETTAFGDKIQVGVLEYINNGDFMGLLRTKPDVETLTGIFEGIMHGLRYLHNKGIIHRDLKPENVLIHKEHGEFIPKIADFGISKVLSENSGESSLVIGSIEYMAPEQFNVVRYGIDKQLHTNLDLWSLGTIIYEAFTGKAPFGKTKRGFSRDEIMRNILQQNLEELQQVPEPFRKIVKRCLVRKAEERAQSVDELLAILYGQEDGTTSKSIPQLPSSGTSVLGGSTSVLNTDPSKSEPFRPSDHNYSKQKYNNKPKKQVHEPNKPNFQDTFSLAYLLPIATGLGAYAFFNSKHTMFSASTPLSEYIIYPAIFCALMMVINLFGLFVRRIKQFEIAGYIGSFGITIYYLVQSYLVYAFANAYGKEVIFDFSKHPFAQAFPIVGLVTLTLWLLLRITKIDWLEIWYFFLGFTFFSYVGVDVWYSSATWQIAIVILGWLSVASSGFLFWQKTQK
ncbi:MAG: serine/threonine protein kinase [Chitinophagales bacterium]